METIRERQRQGQTETETTQGTRMRALMNCTSYIFIAMRSKSLKQVAREKPKKHGYFNQQRTDSSI